MSAIKSAILGMSLVLLPTYSFAATNLLANGDFSNVTTGSGMGNYNAGIPVSWSGIQGQTDNATVLNGAMLFSTMGAHNQNQHKYYITQTFNAASAGDYELSFDYLLRDGWQGNPINGAKVVIDQWYSSATGAATVLTPNIVFSATYGSDRSNAWHIGQKVNLNLSAGTHTLYLGTLGASNANDRAAVLYDNVSISQVTPVPEPETYAMLLAGLGLIRTIAGKRNSKKSGKMAI